MFQYIQYTNILFQLKVAYFGLFWVQTYLKLCVCVLAETQNGLRSDFQFSQLC